MHDFPWMADGYPLVTLAHVSRHEATTLFWANLVRILIPTISKIRFNNIPTSKKVVCPSGSGGCFGSIKGWT
jgi:hypothetical protein